MIDHLIGVILIGGKSSRMGTDKALLSYGKFNQVETLYRMLLKYCKNVYVSCKIEQADQDYLKYFEILQDKFSVNSPTNGILTALETHPNNCILSVAVDLPLISEQTIETLIASRDPSKIATCYKDLESNLPEPLCTLWESQAAVKLKEALKSDHSCPRKVLINSSIKMINPAHEKELFNANNYSEYMSIINDSLDLNM